MDGGAQWLLLFLARYFFLPFNFLLFQLGAHLPEQICEQVQTVSAFARYVHMTRRCDTLLPPPWLLAYEGLSFSSSLSPNLPYKL